MSFWRWIIFYVPANRALTFDFNFNLLYNTNYVMRQKKGILTGITFVYIIWATEPDTPLNDADHVGSFFLFNENKNNILLN